MINLTLLHGLENKPHNPRGDRVILPDSITRLNADRDNQDRIPRLKTTQSMRSEFLPNRTQTYGYALSPGRKSPVETFVSTRSKWMQKGRVDPQAAFHGCEIRATEIDCHKRKISRTPTRDQIRETEPADVQALLDDWESRTGKTAPSRR